MKSITIIGGGPAALMLAAHINTEKYQVTIYDQKKTVGRKFLVAGEGGLNLTYSSPLEEFIAQYTPSDFMAPSLQEFTNEDLIKWLGTLGVPTFVGSSNRVFPKQGIKPIEVLHKIVAHLEAKGIKFELETPCTGWSENGDLNFEGKDNVVSDITVFTLGGASWKVTGSDGSWATIFKEKEIIVQPFRAVNCAFGVEWNKNFTTTHSGKLLKNIAIRFNKQKAKGELVISEFGLEGNAIYALSEKLQEGLSTSKTVEIYLDLKPTMSVGQLKAKYKKSKHTKITDILKEDLNLDRTAVGLVKQCTDKETFLNPDLLVEAIKSLPIALTSPDHIDKAISTLGGIDLGEVDGNYQLKKLSSTFAIGEMLDWNAPTGGYLLQGCFSMGFALAQHLNEQQLK